MAGVEKQDAVLCFPLALQFHEQEIPAQKGPGKGWRPGDSRSPSLSPRLVHGGEEASCRASARLCTPAHFPPAPPQGLKQ